MPAKKETAFGGEQSYRELAEHGRALAASEDIREIADLLNKMKGKEVIEVQRSSAMIANASDVNLPLFHKFIPQLIEILKNNTHRSAPRIAFRILEKLSSIPEEHLGELVDLSFRYLNSSGTSIAEKVFAMTVIANQIDTYPDIRHELEASLSAQIRTGSAGFRNRATKIAAKYGLKL